MDRRDFIKSGLLAAAVGAMSGPKAIAQEAEKQAAREQLSKDILNYNPQMQYRPMGRTGVNVSALGFGMLRLPMKNGHVDFDQTTPMVRRAIEGGVNYIDTGRVYLGGESEQAVGKALAGGWRDRVYVTSKMPWWEMQSADDFEKFFDQSRRTIGTDVIDFYHIHMIMHRAWKDYVLPYRLIEKMERLKAQGKIRFIGFSFHDSQQLFKQVVEYTPAWDFCLIQHNYLDYEYEAGVLGPKYAAAIYAYRHAPGHIDCTGCYQCIPYPHNVAIGYIFAYVYNNYVLHQNKERAMADYTVSMSPVQRGDPASSCIACGECLAKCPQHLDIPSLLAKVKETMGK